MLFLLAFDQAFFEEMLLHTGCGDRSWTLLTPGALRRHGVPGFHAEPGKELVPFTASGPPTGSQAIPREAKEAVESRWRRGISAAP